MGSRGRMLGQAHWNLPAQYDCVDMKNGIKVKDIIDKIEWLEG